MEGWRHNPWSYKTRYSTPDVLKTVKINPYVILGVASFRQGIYITWMYMYMWPGNDSKDSIWLFGLFTSEREETMEFLEDVECYGHTLLKSPMILDMAMISSSSEQHRWQAVVIDKETEMIS